MISLPKNGLSTAEEEDDDDDDDLEDIEEDVLAEIGSLSPLRLSRSNTNSGSARPTAHNRAVPSSDAEMIISSFVGA